MFYDVCFEVFIVSLEVLGICAESVKILILVVLGGWCLKLWEIKLGSFAR